MRKRLLCIFSAERLCIKLSGLYDVPYNCCFIFPVSMLKGSTIDTIVYIKIEFFSSYRLIDTSMIFFFFFGCDEIRIEQ